MISPKELLYLIIKLLVVVLAVAGVDDAVVTGAMFQPEEAGDVMDGVAVGFLKARGGEGHGDDVGGDVGEV